MSRYKKFYVYGTERVAMIVPNTLGTTPSRIQFNEATYFLTDHLGNTRVAYMDSPGSDPYIINAVEEFAFANEDEMATNVRAKAMRYYPYGKVLREYDNGAGDRYLTTQHERDRETGLDYRGTRYYDSDVARFLSLDPLAAKYPFLSPYNYVGGNPIMLIDPDGREIRNSKGEDISTPKHEKETRWTENHVRLNEIFGDANGFNQTIKNKVDLGQNLSEKPSSIQNKEVNKSQQTNQNVNNISPPSNYSYPGVIFITVNSMGYGSGLTLPPYIYLGPTDGMPQEKIENIKMHEYGHFLQFIALGKSMKAYLGLIGLPSLVSASTSKNDSHDSFFTEVTANVLAYHFFGKPSFWDTDRFPLTFIK